MFPCFWTYGVIFACKTPGPESHAAGLADRSGAISLRRLKWAPEKTFRKLVELTGPFRVGNESPSSVQGLRVGDAVETRKSLAIREDRSYRILTRFHFFDSCRNEFFNSHRPYHKLALLVRLKSGSMSVIGGEVEIPTRVVDCRVSNSLMSLCQAFEFCLVANGFSRSA